MQVNKLKEKLKNKEVAFGTFIRMNEISVEIMGYTGWDFVIIDVEHGVHDFQDVSNMIRAAHSAGITCIIRVPGTAPINIQRYLDAGADGVQIPQITSIEEAEKAVKGAHYYPMGNRGACGYSAATHYHTIPFTDHVASSNQEALVVLHVENAWAADHIDELLEIEGIDTIFCGPWDMSQSLGIPGQVEDERVQGRIQKVFDACAAKGVATGMFVDDPVLAKKWIDRGVTYMTCQVDAGIYSAAAKATVDKLKDCLK